MKNHEWELKRQRAYQEALEVEREWARHSPGRQTGVLNR